MSNLTLGSAFEWIDDSFKSYSNHYVLDAEYVVSLLPKSIITAAEKSELKKELNKLFIDTTTFNAAKKQIVDNNLLKHLNPLVSQVIMDVASKAFYRDTVWHDLSLPLVGVMNIVNGLLKAVFSIVTLIKDLMAFPVHLMTSGMDKLMIDLRVSSCRLWESCKAICNGALQLFASPLLCVRVPARCMADLESTSKKVNMVENIEEKFNEFAAAIQTIGLSLQRMHGLDDLFDMRMGARAEYTMPRFTPAANPAYFRTAGAPASAFSMFESAQRAGSTSSWTAEHIYR